VTAGLIWENGKVLIAKRPKGRHLEGFWEFPGGKKEAGETLRSCLEREIWEELGLKVAVGKALLSVDHDYGSKRISLHFFDCTLLAGTAEGLEGQEIKWVTPGDLDKGAFPPPDHMLIDLLKRCRGKR
jgi:mutator protein MutT